MSSEKYFDEHTYLEPDAEIKAYFREDKEERFWVYNSDRPLEYISADADWIRYWHDKWHEESEIE